MTDERRIPLLVLGLGNVICGDDAAGVEAVQRLNRDWELPEGMIALDGGTLGLSLLPWVEEADSLILVDAVRTGDAPGSLVRLLGNDVPPAAAQRLSPHQFGVSDLLDGAVWTERMPSRLVLLGVVPESLELCTVGLTPAVEGAIDALVGAVLAEAREMGFEPRRRAVAAEGSGSPWR